MGKTQFKLNFKHYICIAVTFIGFVVYFFSHLFTTEGRIAYDLSKRGITRSHYIKYSKSVDPVGCTFKDLFSGRSRSNSKDSITAVACAKEDYTITFEDVLRDLVGLENRVEPGFRYTKDLNYSKVLKNGKLTRHKDHILGATISVHRNLDHMPFRRAMDAGTAHRVEEIIKNAIKAMNANGPKMEYVSLESLSTIPSTQEAEFSKEVYKDALIDLDQQREVLNLSLYKDEQTKGLGVVYNQDASLYAIINGEDHLIVTSKVKGGDFGPAMERLYSFLGATKLRFAVHPKYGYLTARPENVGTGLIVNIYLKLPNLSKNTATIEQFAQQHNLTIRRENCLGEGAFLLRNKVKINIGEADVINKTIVQAAELIQMEENLD